MQQIITCEKTTREFNGEGKLVKEVREVYYKAEPLATFSAKTHTGGTEDVPMIPNSIFTYSWPAEQIFGITATSTCGCDSLDELWRAAKAEGCNCKTVAQAK